MKEKSKETKQIKDAPAAKPINRKIHYHDLKIKFNVDFAPKEDKNQFVGFFSMIAKMVRDKEEIRYQKIGENKIFLQDVSFDQTPGTKLKRITGKMLSSRGDVFPEVLNLETDKTKGLETDNDKDEIVETTHFVIDYSKPTKKIAIEYNHAGAKITDFIIYCDRIGTLKNATETVDENPVTKDELSKIKARMGKISTIIMRVHRDNISKIESMDKSTFEAMNEVEELFDTEYIELKMRFSAKKTAKSEKANTTVANLITSLISNKKNVHTFNSLKVRAKDSERNFKSSVFDLLIDKVESDISVQKNAKYKTVVSTDIFEKMKDEMITKRI